MRGENGSALLWYVQPYYYNKMSKGLAGINWFKWLGRSHVSKILLVKAVWRVCIWNAVSFEHSQLLSCTLPCQLFVEMACTKVWLLLDPSKWRLHRELWNIWHTELCLCILPQQGNSGAGLQSLLLFREKFCIAKLTRIFVCWDKLAEMSSFTGARTIFSLLMNLFSFLFSMMVTSGMMDDVEVLVCVWCGRRKMFMLICSRPHFLN